MDVTPMNAIVEPISLNPLVFSLQELSLEAVRKLFQNIFEEKVPENDTSKGYAYQLFLFQKSDLNDLAQQTAVKMYHTVEQHINPEKSLIFSKSHFEKLTHELAAKVGNPYFLLEYEDYHLNQFETNTPKTDDDYAILSLTSKDCDWDVDWIEMCKNFDIDIKKNLDLEGNQKEKWKSYFTNEYFKIVSREYSRKRLYYKYDLSTFGIPMKILLLLIKLIKYRTEYIDNIDSVVLERYFPIHQFPSVRKIVLIKDFSYFTEEWLKTKKNIISFNADDQLGYPKYDSEFYLKTKDLLIQQENLKELAINLSCSVSIAPMLERLQELETISIKLDDQKVRNDPSFRQMGLFENETQAILKLKNLKHLAIPVVDEASLLSILQTFNGLKTLSILDSIELSAVFQQIESLQLQSITLVNDSLIDNEDIEIVLDKCPKLKSLTLLGRLRVIEPFKELKQSYELEHLEISIFESNKIIPNSINCHINFTNLETAFPNLKELTLELDEQEMISHLHFDQLVNLEKIELRGIYLKDLQDVTLFKTTSKLKNLEISECDFFSDWIKGDLSLPSLQTFRYLWQDNGLLEITKASSLSLQSLTYMNGKSFSSDQMPYLPRLKFLYFFSREKTKVSDAFLSKKFPSLYEENITFL